MQNLANIDQELETLLDPACALESINNSLRCCICTDSFTDPRILACGHTFCLQCLVKLLRNNAIACPLCRKQFSIKQEELVELPRNTIIKELLGLSKKPGAFETMVRKPTSSLSESAPNSLHGEWTGHSVTQNLHYLKEGNQKLPKAKNVDVMNETAIKLKPFLPDNPFETEYLSCDVCAESDSINIADIPKATWYCVDCNESQCDACTRSHKRQKLSKNHKITEIDKETKQKLLKKRRMIHDIKITCDICQENSAYGAEENPEATFYCNTCNENQCSNCSREHKRQRLSRDHEIVALDDSLKEKLAKMKMIDTCDVCAAGNDNDTADIVAATQFCVNCREKQCDQCSNEHKRQKMSKNHDIVPLNDDVKKKYLTEETNVNSTNQQTTAMCDQCMESNGKHNIATMYCTDCEENQCFECSEGHKRQKPCKDHKIVPIDVRTTSTLKERTASNLSKSDHKPERSSEILKKSNREHFLEEVKENIGYQKIENIMDQLDISSLSSLTADDNPSATSVAELGSIIEFEKTKSSPFSITWQQFFRKRTKNFYLVPFHVKESMTQSYLAVEDNYWNTFTRMIRDSTSEDDGWRQNCPRGELTVTKQFRYGQNYEGTFRFLVLGDKSDNMYQHRFATAFQNYNSQDVGQNILRAIGGGIDSIFNTKLTEQGENYLGDYLSEF